MADFLFVINRKTLAKRRILMKYAIGFLAFAGAMLLALSAFLHMGLDAVAAFLLMI